MTVKFYRVGGCVRDEFLGRKSKDIDHAVEAPSFEAMKKEIMDRGGRIYQCKPEFFTIRAMVPMLGDCDFVFCRKEGPYSDGRRPDWVKPGSIEDDLARRDFTINAMAKDENGGIIDPHDGRVDIVKRILKPVGDARQKLTEDGLRIIRALRFSAQLGFMIGSDIDNVLRDDDLMLHVVPQQKKERIRDELEKGFRANSYAMIRVLAKYPVIANCIFNPKQDMWLLPTQKSRKK